MTARAFSRPVLALLLALPACAAPPARQAEVPLPPGPPSAGDPGRAAILSAAYAFGQPSRLAGRPGDTARAAARLEWMAETLPNEPRWRAARADLFPALANARAELRRDLGIQPTAPPAAVAGALIAASGPLDRGAAEAGRSALAPVASDPGTTAARLAALPPQPDAATATALAAREMGRLDQSDEVE